MKKRVGSLVLVLALIFSVLTMTDMEDVKAADGVGVYVTIACKGDVTVAQKKVTVTDRDGDGKYTVDEALYAAHEKYYAGGASAGYLSGMTDYGLSLLTLWGDTSGNFGYYKNHASCWSAEDEVFAGDYLVAFVYQKMAWPIMDVYARFEKDSYVDAPGKISVTLQESGYDASYNLIYSPKKGATLKLYDENDQEVKGFEVTDSGDGTYEVNVPAAGTYRLIATENDTPLVPAVCILSVGSSQDENAGGNHNGGSGSNQKNDGTVNKNHRSIVKSTAEYLMNLGEANIGSEWMVLGLTRAGYDCPKEYYKNIKTYVKNTINDKEQLSATKATENARVILALTAAGYNPQNVGGHNLLKGLTDMSYVEKQGINGPIWTLLAFDSRDYKIPTNRSAKTQVTRDRLIKKILDAQLEDGGWAFSGSNADPDMTAMALQALAPYYAKKEEVKQAVDKALACLSKIQYDNGGFGTTAGNNAPSCAQVVVALTSLGIDPHTDSRFVKNGRSVVDALSTFALKSGGFSNFVGEKRNALATEQGMYAMTAYLRFVDGKTALYDMSDVDRNADTETVSSPKTGDQGRILVYIMFAAACVIVGAGMKKREKADQ